MKKKFEFQQVRISLITSDDVREEDSVEQIFVFRTQSTLKFWSGCMVRNYIV